MEAENMHEEGRMKEIVFSKSVKAGKRIYYFDVKENRAGDLYLSLTESKKIVTGNDETQQVSFEKHKIFLYREDFDKFLASLNEAIDHINQTRGKAEQRPEWKDGIELDIEF